MKIHTAKSVFLFWKDYIMVFKVIAIMIQESLINEALTITMNIA